MRRERWSLLAVVCALSVPTLAVGCSKELDPTPAADAGGEDSAEPGDEPGEQTVELAPSGAEVEPAATVMSSGRFQLVGSLSVSSGTASASQNYELQRTTVELRQR
jgi:hypothetical protein